MKKIFIYALVLFTLVSCGVKQQAEELQALQQCTYEVVSADSVFVAGTPLNKLVSKDGFNPLQAPGVALAYMQQKMPVEGILKLKITNPGSNDAGINQFGYRILIKDVELLNGFVEQKTSISAAGGSTIVPLKINKDIYSLLSDVSNQQAVSSFLVSSEEKKVIITFKIKPKFLVADQIVEYPDEISIDKELTNKELIRYVSRM
jgi:hypothetical protein